MALTTAEKRIITDVVRTERLSADETFDGDFFDQTLTQQKAFLRPRVQALLDNANTTRARVDTEAANQKTRLDTLITILTTLLGKLA